MWIFWASIPGATFAFITAMLVARRSHTLASWAVAVGVTFGLYAVSYVLLLGGLWDTAAEWSASMRYVGLVQPWLFGGLMLGLLRSIRALRAERTERRRLDAEIARIVRDR